MAITDATRSAGPQGFVHLRVRSAYSLLEGAIKAGKVGKLAADAGMPAVAVADNDPDEPIHPDQLTLSARSQGGS